MPSDSVYKDSTVNINNDNTPENELEISQNYKRRKLNDSNVEESEQETDVGTESRINVEDGTSDTDSIEVIDEKIVTSNDDNEDFNLNNAFDTDRNSVSTSSNIERESESIDLEDKKILESTKSPLSNQSPDDTPFIDLESEEQVVEILDDDEDAKELEKSKKPPESYKPIKEYKCPICFDPPEYAMVTTCGHVFCCTCLFQMVNNSKGSINKQYGLCALCRSKVDLKTVKLMILRKKRIKKT